MKYLTFLRPKHSWLLLITSCLFFLLRFPSLFEPYWYGDEGIYETIGLGLRHGRLLYQGIWDNKPPVLYLLYALVDANQFAIRLLSLLAGLLAIFSFYYLCLQLFTNSRLSYFLTAIFALLFATPYIEGNIANAENFMLFPIILGAVLLYTAIDKRLIKKKILGLTARQFLLGSAGFLLGIAFLTKIVAVFDFTAFLFFLVLITLPETLELHHRKHLLLVAYSAVREYLIGFFIPFGVTFLYFLVHGALKDFLHASFFNNISYVGYGNAFIIPQGYLIIKLIFLIITIAIIVLKRKSFTNSKLFILLWISFSLFSMFFSQRPYTHYVLMGLSSLTLGLGLVIQEKKRRFLYLMLLLISTIFILFYFHLTKPLKVVPYYQNFVSYIVGKKDTISYKAFFDRNTPRDYAIASFVLLYKKHSDDSIFVWGNSAQIYPLSKSLPPGKYTVAYHITGNPEALTETKEALHTNVPVFVILLPDYTSYPFSLTGYRYLGKIEDSSIYERRDE